jgi:hypothetical protein
LHGDIDDLGDIANIATFARSIFLCPLHRMTSDLKICFGKSGKNGKTFATSTISASAFFLRLFHTD